MSLDISEADWKVFKKLHKLALERFFQQAVKEIIPLLDNARQPAQEQFWDIFNLAQDRRKRAADLFDDFRRSSAVLTTAMIARQNLWTSAELNEFTPAMREKLNQLLDNSKH